MMDGKADVSLLQEAILHDASLLHKAYNLFIPTSGIDEKEEGLEAFGSNRNAKRANSNFLNLFKAKRNSKQEVVASASASQALTLEGFSSQNAMRGESFDSRNSSDFLAGYGSGGPPGVGESQPGGRGGNAFARGVLGYIRQRLELEKRFAAVMSDHREANPWMVVIASHDPFVFYYISFRTYAKTLFVNIYSNRTAISYRFPFISFFNEYCNATLLKRVQNLVIHDGYSSLLESTLATLSNRLLRPVSFYNTSFVFSFAEANSPLPYNKELSALLFKHGAGMGLQFHSDSSRAVYATVHTEYLHTNKTTQPAGLTLADDSTATPSPLPMRGKSEEAKKLVIAVEGIDFVVVFFLPEKMTFLVVLQACDETKDPARVKREVEGIVEEWTTDFFHQIRDLYISTSSDLTLVDTSRNRVDPALFDDHLRPLLLFFRSSDQYASLVSALEREFYTHAILCAEKKRVLSVGAKPFRYLIVVEFSTGTEVHLIDTKSSLSIDEKQICSIRSQIMRILHLLVFSF
ncbi:hypothetical protein BLSTO_04281 [Blastocystis sp. subtype 1]